MLVTAVTGPVNANTTAVGTRDVLTNAIDVAHRPDFRAIILRHWGFPRVFRGPDSRAPRRMPIAVVPRSAACMAHVVTDARARAHFGAAQAGRAISSIRTIFLGATRG